VRLKANKIFVKELRKKIRNPNNMDQIKKRGIYDKSKSKD
jgi:hypothetical protein